mgnify:CR=1 FL=1
MTKSDGMRERWERADALIRTWWDADVRRAGEEQIRDPRSNEVWFVDDEHRAREQKGAAAEELEPVRPGVSGDAGARVYG